MTIGAKIRAMRESNGMTQDDLASKLSVTQSFIAQVERGTKSLSFTMAVQVAEVFGADIRTFL